MEEFKTSTGYLKGFDTSTLEVRYGNNVHLQYAKVPPGCPLAKETEKKAMQGEIILQPIPKIAQKSKQTHHLLGLIADPCYDCPFALKCKPNQAYINNINPINPDKELFEGVYFTRAVLELKGYLFKALFPDQKREAHCEAPDICLIPENCPTVINLVYQHNDEAFRGKTSLPTLSIIGVDSQEYCPNCPYQGECMPNGNYHVYTRGKQIHNPQMIVEPIIIGHRKEVYEGKGRGKAHTQSDIAKKAWGIPGWVNDIIKFFRRKK